MKRILTALLALGLVVPAWAQDKGEGKQDGGDEKKLIEKEGGGEKKAPSKEGGEAAIPVKEVDTNGDGMISASELKAALGKLGGGSGGEKKGVKVPVKEGGDGVKKLPPKEGDGAEKKAPVKEGGDKEGEKRAPAKDGGK
jgi:hypothetical protein